MILIWLLFSAVIDPETNLVKGVILVTVVLVPLNVTRRLLKSKSLVTEIIDSRMDKLLADKVKEFINENPKVADRVGGTVDDDEGGALPMDLIFAVLDKSGDSRLVFSEFVGMFEVRTCHVVRVQPMLTSACLLKALASCV